jgi:sterol desaturase/sphingolipid hydroxylase (fatty acid hydroxylase superfamily)
MNWTVSKALFFLHCEVYWLSALFFTFLDFWPFQRYCKSTTYHHAWRSIKTVMPLHIVLKDVAVVLLNQVCCTLPLSMLLSPWFANDANQSVPLVDWMWMLIGLVLIEEILFYATHRMLHYPWLYKHVHWFHHRWDEPIALVALSAHPVEHVVSNLLPFLIGPCILQTPLVVTRMWIILATLNAVLAHSGYALLNQGRHDLHHRIRNGNYGALGLADWLMGTLIPVPTITTHPADTSHSQSTFPPNTQPALPFVAQSKLQ